jgi:alpha-glucosidase (family GH31 glycosyl hydrolase)
VEKGADHRKIYLPRGDWYDFWTNEKVEGGRELSRAIDLETIPLYVRAGGILPFGPVKQYVDESVEQPLSISIYPGGDASFLLYEDDGRSFNYRKGEWTGLELVWNDKQRVLALSLAPGSQMLPLTRKNIEVKLLQERKQVVFKGNPLKVSL